MFSLAPISTRLRSRLGFAQHPDQVVEIEPGCNWEMPPPISLPNEAERIVRHAEGINPAISLNHLTNPIISQGPTRAKMWKDALLVDSTILSKNRVAVLGRERRRAILFGSPEVVPEAAICSTFQTEHYFGHWLLDGLAHEVLAREMTVPPRTFEVNDWPHKLGYRQLTDLSACPVTYARVERLWILDDAELNQSRARRILELRRRIRLKASGKSKYVFIERGDSGSMRNLINQVEIRSVLERQGFSVLAPERSTPIEIANALAAAEIVVSVEGSALAHAMLCAPDGASILTIQPPQRFNAVYRGYCGALGFQFGFAVADMTGPDDFRLEASRLLKTIDLLGRR